MMPSLNSAAAKRRRISRSNSAGGMRALASASPGKVKTKSSIHERYAKHQVAASPEFAEPAFEGKSTTTQNLVEEAAFVVRFEVINEVPADATVGESGGTGVAARSENA